MKKIGRAFLMLLLTMVAGLLLSGFRGEAQEMQETGIDWIYVSPDAGYGQTVVIKFSDIRPSSAVLTYRSGSGNVSQNAEEVKDTYAAFLIEGGGVSGNKLVSVSVSGGAQITFDLQNFRRAAGTDSVTVENKTVSSRQSVTKEQVGVIAESAGQIQSTLRKADRQVPYYESASGVTAGGNIVIVLDPGHGGYDGGAMRTWNGVLYKESEIALKISQYTKQELEKYSGVTVYLTRNSDVYLTLAERVDYADSVGATALISQHINSTGSNQSTATGAEVMVSSGNYRPDQAAETKAIAETILNSLSKIGFTNRGLVYYLSQTGDTYPNGQLADYYGIVRRSVLAGFPGMIVEHGFVSNPSDCERYYGSEAKIKALGVADAQAIAEYYGLKKKSAVSSEKKGKWVRQGENVLYQYADGSYAKGIATIKGKKYYFSAKGYRRTGWKKVNKKYYYFHPTYYAAVRGGWKTINGKRYYFTSEGVRLQKCWKTINGKKYYFSSQGVVRRGFIKIGSDTYYADRMGARRTGWIRLKGKWYYFKPTNGKMIAGRMAYIKGQWYTFDENGVSSRTK